ncbi:MAG: Glu/Leu/Phe/Val dehydrogenase [Deltaproteobacteria bacterium]|nr:Glu/Leu/Phe/Val dehydrogenase [Deltaproteobacteria bacterium]
MEIFRSLSEHDHEEVFFMNDNRLGLKAIVAIHNTILGPALGGCRMWTFASEEEALRDALRLSRGMTYKAAVAGLNLGGGKAVIIGDPKKDKSEALFRAYGRFVQGLGGRYITAEDMGTSVRDMEWVRMETQYVTGISRALGGSGDPSPVTALGVYHGMKACAREVFGRDSLSGLTVAIQGVGHVGYPLAQHLHAEGCRLVVADIDRENLDRAARDLGAEVVEGEAVFDVACDLFAPCARGGLLNDKTIPRLRCKIVAGAANNQLEDEARHGAELLKRGILYAPDYVINSGGLINVANELEGYNQERALKQATGIYDILARVLAISKEERIPTHVASDKLAVKRIQELGRVKQTYTGWSEGTFHRRRQLDS